MNIKTLQIALLNSWNKDTCYPSMEKGWSSKNPAYGQCYVTALIVNDYFGGKILKTKFKDGTGHFWNLINEEETDLTKSQFDKDEIIPKPTIHSRKEIENNSKYEEYNRRYLILKKRVEDFFKKSQIEKEFKVRKSYLKKLEKLRNEKTIRVDNFKKQYELD